MPGPPPGIRFLSPFADEWVLIVTSLLLVVLEDFSRLETICFPGERKRGHNWVRAKAATIPVLTTPPQGTTRTAVFNEIASLNGDAKLSWTR